MIHSTSKPLSFNVCKPVSHVLVLYNSEFKDGTIFHAVYFQTFKFEFHSFHITALPTLVFPSEKERIRLINNISKMFLSKVYTNKSQTSHWDQFNQEPRSLSNWIPDIFGWYLLVTSWLFGAMGTIPTSMSVLWKVQFNFIVDASSQLGQGRRKKGNWTNTCK